MHKYLFTGVAFLLAFSLSAQNDKRLRGIEKDLQEVLEATNAPGFAVAIVEKDRIIYANGFGYRDLERQVPVNENTLFAIGSSTKAFTSAILGYLREEGSISSFDDNPRKYLPELEFNDANINGNVTIKDLMRHTTGIPRHDLSWYLFSSSSPDSLLKRIKYLKPFTGLRQQWYYNNFMFLVQGEIGHHLTGKSWRENIEELFFKPLSMTRSSTKIDDLLKEDNRALGYATDAEGNNEKLDYYRIAGMGAAGSINSSVREMSNWLITWINGGKFNGKQVIPPAYVKEALTPSAVVDGGMAQRIFMLEDNPQFHTLNYGYGWFISDYRGHYKVQHGGNIDGFSASATFYPADSIGVVVLSNQNGSGVPTLVDNIVADYILKLDKKDWTARYEKIKSDQKKMAAQAEQEEDAGKVKNTRPSHSLPEYAGIYEAAGYGKFEIKFSNDSLFAYLPNNKSYLKHFHYDVFVPYAVKDGKVDTVSTLMSQFKMNFISNLSGDIDAAHIFVEPALSEPAIFKRTPVSIEVTPEKLQSYAGEYELMGTVIKIYTKEDNKLYAFVPNQPEYELLALKKHLFMIKGLDGFKIEFTDESEGIMKNVKFIQPNGTFTAKRKE